ncbi:MAG: hypothetical protein HY000_17315 [Planctomycetes bacterium]|nr:hypothetical protein [Planctomycetota bacterium]
MLNSNLDWGQDLIYLKEWIEKHPHAKPLSLAYFGPMDPRVLGIEFSVPPASKPHTEPVIQPGVPPETLAPGYYAVSANLVAGEGYSIPDDVGGRREIPQFGYMYFRMFKPIDRAGYSILIYHLTPNDIARLSAMDMRERSGAWSTAAHIAAGAVGGGHVGL